ncbi:transporter substrate-binding domain-containing protein [Roseococcus sp. SDR]|uniref:transporter substrate-binding domain-containing protein n=1 Tax=Roseococcus sp. SDR TaxID=2835532 RepID=UPI001BCD6AA4|nr:transporter substrate-binding domain-containing protein [Roseococcus sp. SDR]MBS7788597.1 transporter substrate-binding domain-containing protein [Roseococcus sp. SDR]MBV1843911.1 transporter substrate-binding domain-containing protein [Roseococcus sp. SDR]
MISRRATLVLPALLALPAHAQDTVAIARQIAPTGTLRAVINLGNPLLASRRPRETEAHGVSVDIVRELARRLALPLEVIPVPSANRSVELLRGGDGDIGFFAVDASRGQGMDLTPPFLEVEGVFLVREHSPIIENEQVDERGIRIAVGFNSVYDIYLRREIRDATLVRVATSPRVVEEFLRQNIDVAAGVRQQLEADAARFGGLRVLPGRFHAVQYAMGLADGRNPAAVAFLAAFLAELTRSGFVAQSMARHGVRLASVVMPD